MPAPRIAAVWAGSSRRASSPPWILGCSVFTRPSSISGKPVCAETSVTGTPSFDRSCAVPPVERSCTPSAASPRPSSTKPDLSETLSSARLIFVTTASRPLDPQLLDLLAQRIAVDAEHLGGERLVARGLAEHGLDHRLLDVLEHHVV